MSSRTRIGRLANSLEIRRRHTAATPKTRGTAGSTGRISTRAFDDGATVALYTDGTDPTGANDVDPTTGTQAAAPPAEPIAAHPPTTTTVPAAAAPAPAAPTTSAQAQQPASRQPAAVATTPDTTQISPATATPTAGTNDVGGWTIHSTPETTEASDLAFAEDIQAILAHAKGVSGTSRVPLPNVPPAPAAPAPPAVAYGVGAGATHDVFDQMAAANAPQRIDQGPVSLSVDFDRLDRALESLDPAQPAAPAPTSSPAPTSPPGAAPVDAAVTPAAPSSPSPERVADVADVAAITAAGTPFRVVTDVPLVPEGPGLSCHAAACAAIVAWRDDLRPDAAEVAAGTGYWERYADGRTAIYPDILESFGLSNASIGRPPTAAVLRDLLDVNGPLFVAASPPGEHAVVVTGVTGDGTSSATIVDVVDPWAAGMTTYAPPNPGSRYSVPYSTLLESIGTGPEHDIVVAHLRKASS